MHAFTPTNMCCSMYESNIFFRCQCRYMYTRISDRQDVQVYMAHQHAAPAYRRCA